MTHDPVAAKAEAAALLKKLSKGTGARLHRRKRKHGRPRGRR